MFVGQGGSVSKNLFPMSPWFDEKQQGDSKLNCFGG